MVGARSTTLNRVAVLAFVACLLGALIDAPSALAVTHTAATRVALRALHPKREHGPVVVFSVPGAVRAGGFVYEAGPPPAPARVHALRHPVYVYWEDLAHGAYLAHPSRLLLIDARTGRVVRRQNMRWFLIINNRLAPFLATAAGYEGRRYVVYDSSPTRRTSRSHAHSARYAADGHPTPRKEILAHDCFIPIGDFRDPLFKGGGKAMLTFASRIGLRTFEPATETAKALSDAVDRATAAGCDDVFIYLAGHGNPPDEAAFPAGAPRKWYAMAHPTIVGPGAPASPAAVMTSPGFAKRAGKLVDESSYVTPQNLIQIAKAHEEADFKIKIDSCFSDRFAPVFDDTDNVRVLETSSSFDEVSAGGYVDGKQYDTTDPKTHRVNGSVVNHIDDPDRAGGFTNGNVHGLYTWAAFSDPTEDLVVGLAAAYGLGMRFNQSVEFGYTIPHRRTRPARMKTTSLTADGLWSVFDPTEVRLAGRFSVLTGAPRSQPVAHAADASSPIDAVKVVVPPAGSTPRQITNTLCPSQLPHATVSTTTSTNDTLTCDGGTLPVGQSFQLNVQTNPPPSSGMGGQLFGRQDGTFQGPFQITGP